MLGQLDFGVRVPSPAPLIVLVLVVVLDKKCSVSTFRDSALSLDLSSNRRPHPMDIVVILECL